MNRTDLQKLARTRLKEAKALYRASHYSGAYYLAGYAAECALKACIAKDTKRHDFPDKERVQKSYTHKLSDLATVAGLKATLDKDLRANAKFAASWELLAKWSEESRYKIWAQTDAQSIIEAVSKSSDGVLPWIMQRW
jgi:HEPN domain-containing protein